MIIYPAIDLRGGRCVRLVEGDFDRETVFSDDPVATARRWESEGAEWIHIVDLDGARTGTGSNYRAIQAIRAAISIPMQVGGGIRNETSAAKLIEIGTDRIILGTAAVTDRSLVERLCAAFGNKIAVGLDTRAGLLAIRGWLEQSDIDALSLAKDLREIGVETFIVTDINRDGKLQGANLELLTQFQNSLKTGIIASGGIGSIDDVSAIVETGIDGLIIGRALYDGRVRLREAISTGGQRVSV